jgi:cyclopropane fatty-acyl-phospholipid synthase-like methyltransferase
MQIMSKFGGMTVNERLYEAGFFPIWDEALKNADKNKLREILSQVELADQADVIIESALDFATGLPHSK